MKSAWYVPGYVRHADGNVEQCDLGEHYPSREEAEKDAQKWTMKVLQGEIASALEHGDQTEADRLTELHNLELAGDSSRREESPIWYEAIEVDDEDA